MGLNIAGKNAGKPAVMLPVLMGDSHERKLNGSRYKDALELILAKVNRSINEDIDSGPVMRKHLTALKMALIALCDPDSTEIITKFHNGEDEITSIPVVVYARAPFHDNLYELTEVCVPDPENRNGSYTVLIFSRENKFSCQVIHGIESFSSGKPTPRLTIDYDLSTTSVTYEIKSLPEPRPSGLTGRLNRNADQAS
ncbi:MAG: hypothetical protein QY312_02950 [Candidatus Dojkabacteria bacterium]|nr:MAG: hypothetical protein QY312_02950 [Candidatus Dojkabacteria bacterium]